MSRIIDWLEQLVTLVLFCFLIYHWTRSLFKETFSQRLVLARLLQEDDYLWRVLRHLVDTDLQECRLVCRQWRKVCSQLPIKLTLSLDPQRLRLIGQFESATSIDLVFKTHQPVLQSNINLIAQLFALLPLKHLSMILPPRHLDECIRFSENGMEEMALSLKNLESLHLGKCHTTYEDASELLIVLTKLTAFSYLCLDAECADRPAMEIGALKELGIPAEHLLDWDGHVLLPTSTRLKRLQLTLCHAYLQDVDEGDKRLCCSLSHAFPSLVELRVQSLGEPNPRELPFVYFPDLHNFEALETVAIRYVRIAQDDFNEKISQCSTVKTLMLCWLTMLEQRTQPTSQGWFKHLQSLTLPPYWQEYGLNNAQLETFVELTQLHFPIIDGNYEIPVIQGLKDLTCFSNEPETQLQAKFAHLTNLEKLELSPGDSTKISSPSLLLAPLKKLEMLKLGVSMIDDDLIPLLLKLTSLTMLEFTHCKNIDNQRLAQLSQMSTLISLNLFDISPANDHGFLALGDGQMSRLRYLEIFLCDVTDSVIESLRAKFPFLRK